MFKYLQENTCVGAFRPETLKKKKTPTQVFLVDIAKALRIAFL